MFSRKIVISLFVFLSFLVITSKAQILFNMDNYRNLAYTSIGYTGAFDNTTIGIARRDSIKLIKREVIGILDVSLPVTDRFFTNHTVRKGFQLNVYKKDFFRVPFMFASSSIIRENHLYKYDDITAEFGFVPGIYQVKYTIALDFKYELIAFRHEKFKPNYLRQLNPQAKNHWEEPMVNIGKIGIVAGLNLKRFVIYFKTGYEGNPIPKSNLLPLYALGGFGYKFGTKPFKNRID